MTIRLIAKVNQRTQKINLKIPHIEKIVGYLIKNNYLISRKNSKMKILKENLIQGN